MAYRPPTLQPGQGFVDALGNPLSEGDLVSWGKAKTYSDPGLRIGIIRRLNPTGKLTCTMLTGGSPSVEAWLVTRCMPLDEAHFIGREVEYVYVDDPSARYGISTVEGLVVHINSDYTCSVQDQHGKLWQSRDKLFELRFK